MSQAFEILVRSVGAKRVLAIGMTGAASRIAKALPADGLLMLLEPDRESAVSARTQLEAEGLAERAVVVIATPAHYLHKIAGPFDVIFHNAPDAEREPVRARLQQLLKPGAILMTGANLTEP
jgi:predicted O-methyltransferase YrrM